MSSARQEPQGQEHRGDPPHCESSAAPSACHLYQLHGEELPSYEEAKAHSQYRGAGGQQQQQQQPPDAGAPWDLKREHARSLSERLMQLSLERNGNDGPRHPGTPMTSSHSYPQLCHRTAGPPAAGPESRGPPPEYPFCVRLPGYMLSRSEEQGHQYRDPPPPFNSQHRFVSAQPQTQTSHRSLPGGHYHPAGPGSSDPYIATATAMTAFPSMPFGGNGGVVNGNAAHHVDTLLRENERLHQELEVQVEKTARLQKREALEKTMRNKMEAEIKRLHDFNRDLRERLETATRQRLATEVESTEQKQHIFTKLIEQNEEQQRERERVERQVQHLRASSEEWARRREALEKALSAAQSRNLQLDDELRRKRAYVSKVEGLQSALAQLQAACEKRETLELRLRTRLEQELKNLRAQQQQSRARTAAPGGSSDLQHQQQLNWSRLQQHVREREERVLALEADITKWEQKYLEESTMRQFAMDAAATAAAQRDTTIINQTPGSSPNSSFNEELPSHQSPRQQEMKNRIRALHAQLLEKDAVIQVLQQRSRWESGRLEKPGLRLAHSVPASIDAMGNSSSSGNLAPAKGKSLSDDQTCGAMLPSRRSSAGPLGQDQDSITQSSYISTFNSPSQGRNSPQATLGVEGTLKTFNELRCSDADVVEVLI
ncbi:hypothetical protein CRUP_031852 [Coryphaenoides rupestris]|nr:hypothetical protein CRUP_031852 [Coryphaenoides rupestris]